MIEVLNGLHETIVYGNSLGLKIYKNTDPDDFPEHWHTGVEIIMPIIDEYAVVIEEKYYHLKVGDIIVINSGVLHRLEAPPSGERIIMQFDVALLYSLKEMETLLSVIPPVFLLTKSAEKEIYDFIYGRINKIVEEYDEKRTFCEAVIYAKLIEMYAEIGRNATNLNFNNYEGLNKGQNGKQKEYLEVIMNTCNYINQHYQENLTLDETACVSGFSKFHFTRIFKQYMNMTFYEYLNSKRIKKAEELLYSTEMTITDVAMNSGFSSLSAFNRTFKSKNRCSPSEFRNKVL